MWTPRVRVLVAVVALILGGAALHVWHGRRGVHGQEQEAAEFFCPMHPQIVRDRPGDCPICGMKLEKRPSIRSDRPAKDDMRMDYVPVYEDDTESASSVPGRAVVTVAPDKAQLLGIRSEVVGTAFPSGSVRTVGRVAVDERRREVVHAKYEGYVERLFVDFTGKPVGKGQPLLTIYSPELVAAQNEYLVARGAQARLGGSGVPGVARGSAELAEAARQRLRALDMPAEEIAALERTGQARRSVTLRSPATGIVVEKVAVEGMKVSPDDRLYEIADLSRVWVLAELYERDLGTIRVGSPTRVTFAGQPASAWTGTVAFLSPIVKPDTRTVEARLEVANPAGVLRPDTFVDVTFERSPDAALTVPESAVVRTGERTLVFVDTGGGRYEPREVTVGARVGEGYEVLRGVSAGERVVVAANFLLDSESSLRAAIARARGAR